MYIHVYEHVFFCCDRYMYCAYIDELSRSTVAVLNLVLTSCAVACYSRHKEWPLLYDCVRALTMISFSSVLLYCVLQEVQKQQSDYQERKRKAERIRRERQQQQHGRNDEVLTNPAPFP